MAGYSVTFSVVDNATKQIDQINRRVAAMRAPMERLSKQVSRFADVSGLNNIAKGFASIGRAAASVLRSLVEIVPILGTITGAATIAGMAKLVGTYADWSQQLVATADSMGMTTKELQQFENAARLAGGRTQDMDAALKGLYQAQSNFIIGKGGDATLWANKLGIEFKDATGHARSMADLMPEVEQKIAAIKNPFDRAAAATALLGERGNDLIETFRRSHQSFGQWMTDAQRYTALSDQQKEQLQAFSEAQGRIATAFDTLGQQIAATLAKNFTPLINKLAAFVEKNTPDIITAVDNISTRFAAWLEGINWGNVEKGLNSVVEVLKWIATHLDTIKEVAEAVAVLFATRWAIGIVASIGQVVSAIGLAGGLAGGVGLLGGLGAVAALVLIIIDHWKDFGQVGRDILAAVNDSITRVKENLDDFWHGRKTNEIKPGETPSYPTPAPFTPGGAYAPTGQPPATPGGAWAPTSTPTTTGGAWANLPAGAGPPRPGSTEAPRQATTPPPARPPGPVPAGQAGPPPTLAEQQENLRRAMDEQQVTDPGMRAGIAAIAAGEGGFQPRSEGGYGNTSNARIRNIFRGRFDSMSDTDLNALKADDKKFFDTVYGGRLGNAPDEGYLYRGRGDFQLTGKGNYERYGKMIGVDLVNNPDLVNDPAISAKISVAYMKDRYHGGGFEGMKRAVGNPVAETEAVKNAKYAEYLRSGQFQAPATQVAQAAAPPAVAPTATAANGTVDVNVTHKNPPPNTAITATASGPGVNVSAPRVEHQELASI